MLQFLFFLFLYEICYAQHNLTINNSTHHFSHSLNLTFPTPFTLFWTTEGHSPNATIGIKAQSFSDGYVALGFNSQQQMVNSRAIIGVSHGNTTSFNDVKITARALYGLNSTEKVASNYSMEYSNGMIAMKFDVPLSKIGCNFNSSCGIIYAMGHATSSGIIEKHIAKSTAKIMLSGQVEYDQSRAIKVAIHAGMMTIAWMILTPLAAFFASPQFRKKMFPSDKSSNPRHIRAHRYTIALAILLVSISFFYALFVIGTRTYLVHFILGITVFSLMVLQGTLGFWRTTIYPNRRSEYRVKGVEKVGKENRHIITFIHTWVGRMLYAMAVVNIVFGQLAYEDYGSLGLVVTGILAAGGIALFSIGPITSFIASG